MRRALTGGVVLALTLAANLVQAAGNDETNLFQVQWPPLPSQPVPVDPTQPAPPGQRVWPLVRQVAPVPCVNYTMKIIPVDPAIDPKFILPAPEVPGVNHTLRKVTPPAACRPAAPVTPAVPRTR